MTTREMKEIAKERLEGNWGLAIGSSMLGMAITGLASSSTVGEIFVDGPIRVGLCSVFSGIVRKEEVPFKRFFHGFAVKYFNNVLLGFLANLFIVLWTLLFIIPGIIMGYAYSMAMFIQNDHPEMTGKAALDASRAMMKGHKWEFFVLNLTFLGWDLLTLLTCGALTIYVSPYKNATYAVYYDYLRELTEGICKVCPEDMESAVKDEDGMAE